MIRSFVGIMLSKFEVNCPVINDARHHFLNPCKWTSSLHGGEPAPVNSNALTTPEPFRIIVPQCVQWVVYMNRWVGPANIIRWCYTLPSGRVEHHHSPFGESGAAAPSLRGGRGSSTLPSGTAGQHPPFGEGGAAPSLRGRQGSTLPSGMAGSTLPPGRAGQHPPFEDGIDIKFFLGGNRRQFFFFFWSTLKFFFHRRQIFLFFLS